MLFASRYAFCKSFLFLFVASHFLTTVNLGTVLKAALRKFVYTAKIVPQPVAQLTVAQCTTGNLGNSLNRDVYRFQDFM
jgi:hypothetical protein